MKPYVKSINDFTYNIWEKITYNENSSLQEFKNYYEKLFKIIIAVILFDDDIVYCIDIDEGNLNKNIYELSDGLNNTINVSINSTDNIDLPNIIIQK